METTNREPATRGAAIAIVIGASAVFVVSACGGSSTSSSQPAASPAQTTSAVSESHAASNADPEFGMVGEVPASSAAEPVDPKLVVAGPLPAVVVRRILALHEARLRECAARGGIERLALDFTIAVSGKAESVVTLPAVPADVAECVRAASGAFEFPEPAAPVTVHYELP